MPKLTPRNYRLADEDFIGLSKVEPIAKARIKLLILEQLKQGKELEEIATIFGYHPQTIGVIRKKYWEYGISSIYDMKNVKKQSGRLF